MRTLISGLLLACTVSCDGGDDVTSARTPVVEARVTLLPCGAQILQNLVLNHDMVCPGSALIVDADGITVDLDGHTITGAGVGNGITVRQRNGVTISGGTVVGYFTGIYVVQSSHVTIREMRLTQHREAISFNGTSNSSIVENVAWQNQLGGIVLRPTVGVTSTNNYVAQNLLFESRSGILILGQPGNTIKGNRISGSSLAALQLTGGGASDNSFSENILDANAAGVLFGRGWTGNNFIENRFVQNTCGMTGPSTGNSFRGNVFVGNVVDACEDNFSETLRRFSTTPRSSSSIEGDDWR